MLLLLTDVRFLVLLRIHFASVASADARYLSLRRGILILCSSVQAVSLIES